MKTPANSDKVEHRMIELISSNQLTMCCELHIFEVIAKKYNFKTLSGYAKSQGLTYNGALDRIKSRKEQFIEIANIKLIF